jgi:peptidyl-prolyl cis-trans isomerase D
MIHRKIIALALGLLLLISGGCSLVEKDEELAAEIENSKTIIEYNGTAVTKGDITMQMTQYLAANSSSIDAVKGMGDDTWKQFKDSFIDQSVINLIALDKARELGLDQLTDEQQASVDASYSSTMATLELMLSPTARAAADADPSLDYDTEYQKLLKNYLNALGYDPDTFRDELVKQTVLSAVKEHFTRDVTVTEEDVRQNYDTNVEIQKSNIELNPDNFAMQASLGGTVLYYPAGYMKVRHILIAFDDDTKSKALEAYSAAGDNTEYDKIIADALPAIQPQVDEVIARIDAGEDFTALIDEYNTDTAMDIEPVHTEGQVAGPYSTDITIPGYLDAVAKLTAAGNYTTITTYSGCYIIRCEQLLEGAVPYDEVKDTLKSGMLANQQESKWMEIANGWVEEAKSAGKLKTYPDRY